MRRDRMRLLTVCVSIGLVLGLGGGVAYALFFSTTSNGANSFAADTDWTAPSGSSVIARSGSTVSGTIRQGSSYYVYADVSDAGNPPAGVASVTADVSAISTGQTAVPLSTTGGPWTIDGMSYAYRSAVLTANNPLSEGSKSYTLTMTDSHTPANSGMQTFSVTVDNSGPTAVDIQATNGGGTAGKPDAGDVVTFTYSEAMSPSSILAGWLGAPTTVDVRLANNGCGVNDTLTVVGVNLGTVCLARGDYVNGLRSFPTSTMVMSGNSFVITLGGTPLTTTAAGPGTMSWTPSTAATDLVGNACQATTAAEQGALDLDF